MTAPQLIDSHDRPCPLAPELGKGGEGTVFPLANDPNLAAKVYHPEERKPDRFEKLRVMIAHKNDVLLKVAAWPTGLLFDARSRQPVGFIMPRLGDGFREIWQLYNPVERLNRFPKAGWKFQVRAAFNLAAAFEEVHKTGCVVGDVQLRNAVVSEQALVRLVDCDSFQVTDGGKQYLCPVGLPHYIPPELQGKSLSGIVRTVNHDCYGMAVLIYQLLFVGRHPYMGLHADDASFDRLIAGFRFSQGPRARSWGMEPPPNTPTFADIPPELGDLFCRAFERGSENGTRPRSSAWLPVLRRLEQDTTVCKVDQGHTYWRGASGGCVWCRLARENGPEYYFAVSETSGPFRVNEERIQTILKRLVSVEAAEVKYNRTSHSPTVRPIGQPLPPELTSLQVAWRVAETALRTWDGERTRDEAQKRRTAEDEEREQIKKIHADFGRRTAALDARLREGQSQEEEQIKKLRADHVHRVDQLNQQRQSVLDTEKKQIEELDAAFKRRTAEFDQRDQLARENERRQIEQVRADFRRTDAELEEEEGAAAEEAEIERQEQWLTVRLLWAAVGFGLILLPVGCIHRGFVWFGALVVSIFAVWLAIHTYLARTTPRRTALSQARIHRGRAEQDHRERIQCVKNSARDVRTRIQGQRTAAEQRLNAQISATREKGREARERIQKECNASETALAQKINLIQETGDPRKLREEQSALKVGLEAAINQRKKLTQEVLAQARQESERTRRQIELNVERAKATYHERSIKVIEARRQAFSSAEKTLEAIERNISELVRRWGVKKLATTSIRTATDQCSHLSHEYQTVCRNLAVRAEQAARTRYLRLQLIADAIIDGFAAERRRTLATHRILTAADVRESVIRGIKGFGPKLTNRLLEWRQGIEAEFEFNSKEVLQSPEHKAAVTQLRGREAVLLKTAETQLAEMEEGLREYQKAAHVLILSAKRALTAYEQAKADFAVAESAF